MRWAGVLLGWSAATGGGAGVSGGGGTGDGDEIAFALTHPARIAGAWNSEIGSWQLRFSSAQLPRAPVTVTAWAFSANTGKARRMSGTLKIDYR